MADEEDDSQKTEEPSDRKLSRARDKGQVASSQEVKSWFVLLAGAAGILMMGPYVARQLRLVGLPYIERPDQIPANFESLRAVMTQSLMDAGWALAPFLLLLLVMAIAGNVMQSGLIFAPEKIKPDISKISPLSGVKRIISVKGFAEFVKSILKLVLVATVAIALTVPLLHDMPLLPAESMGSIVERIQDITVMIVVASAMVMTAIAGIDFAFQKYQFTKSMRMTKQEVKDEHKQAEGDPHVKGRIRALRMQRARERMMSNVPNADVVITNPTHYAVALEYKMEDMSAPKLIAKGIDSLAMRIRAVAEEHDIPIIENPPLARALHAAVELDQEIPPEHFVAVAEVIGYVMRLKGKA